LVIIYLWLYGNIFILLQISAMNTTFLGTVVKVIVMMTGELDFSETFKNPVKSNNTVIVGDNSQSNTLSLVTYAETMWRLFFYTLFLFGIPIGLFNLLTAFALEKVHVSCGLVSRIF